MHTRLTDLGVAAIPFALGPIGPGTYDAGWRLALGAGIGASLYWRRRSPAVTLAACFALGLVQLQDLIDSVPLKVRLQVDGEPRELPQGLALAVFRIYAYEAGLVRPRASAGYARRRSGETSRAPEAGSRPRRLRSSPCL